MKNERYTIEVSDEMVLIGGYLSIREAFDFLAFFDQQGFNQVCVGEENSTLCLTKQTVGELTDSLKEGTARYELERYKLICEELRIKNSQLTDKLEDTENVLNGLRSEEYMKYKRLKDENDKLIRSQMIYNLSQDPIVKRMTCNEHGQFTLHEENNDPTA